MSEVTQVNYEFKKLGEYLKLKGGYAFKSSDFIDQGIPIIRISNIKNNIVDLSKSIFCKESETLEEFSVSNGDILLAMSGATTGKIGRYKLPFKSYLNQRVGCFKLLDSNSTDINFIYHLVSSDEFAEKILIDAIGGAQPNISSSQVEGMFFKFPPLTEQKKISSILTSVDEAIENTQNQIDKLQNLKKATMNELLTKGTGHTGLKDTELGKIPKNWEIFSTSGLYEFKNGLNKEKKAFGRGHRIVNYMDVFSRPEISEEDLNGRVQLSKNEIERFSVSSGDLFFTRTSETPLEIGLSSVITKVSEDVCFSGFILRAKPVNKKIFTKLSGRLYRCDYIRKQIVRTCSYTTRALTNGTSLGKVLVALPSIEEQKEIYTVLKSIEKNIEDKQIEKNKYIFLKKSIMQDLLTGKIRVQVG